jgi:transposase-like protein
MAEDRRKFDEDFRQGAVRIVRETGKQIAQVARELGINEGTLGNWCVKDCKQREGSDVALSEDERAELVRLRRENAELAMQRDVLKRSVALWGERGDGPVSVAAFVAAQRAQYRIPHATTCRALGLSQAWFYKWRSR